MKAPKPTPQLQFVNAATTTATYKLNGQVQQAEIQPDQDGELYYLAGGKAHYLPKEWQPKRHNS